MQQVYSVVEHSMCHVYSPSPLLEEEELVILFLSKGAASPMTTIGTQGTTGAFWLKLLYNIVVSFGFFSTITHKPIGICFLFIQ